MIRLRRGKWRAWGAVPERRLGDHGARLGDAALQIGVLGRVGHVETAGHRGDGASGLQRADMGGGVDAAREAGHHDQRACQLGGQALGHALAVGGGVAAAHQRDRAAASSAASPSTVRAAGASSSRASNGG